MTVAYDNMSYRGWSSSSQSAVCLEDKFEILKDIGDGSFGSVTLGRTRSAGAHLVRRNTLVRDIVANWDANSADILPLLRWLSKP